MRPQKLIGRVQELLALRRELDRDRPSLIVVTGRRRVGKSRLLVEAMRRRPGIYYQATKVTASESLAFFKAEVSKAIGTDPIFEGLSDWHATLAYLQREAAARFPRMTIVLDEFPYLCNVDPSLPSIFQKFWDEVRSTGRPLNLILCGSKISFMEGLLAEKNPLHGRQTLKLDVAPLSYRETARFFPKWPIADRLLIYAIFGGIPFYLSLCDPQAPLSENVIDIVLAKGAPLADEPDNLLQAELRDVTRYATILRAIADGCTKSSDIIGRIREIPNASALAPYIEKLAELRLVRVVRSLDASEKERDRRYFLDDPFLAFWYHFCLPNISALAAGHADQVYKHIIAPRLSDYMGRLFEWICRDHARLFIQEKLRVAAQEVGQIWAGDFDIDVAGKLLDTSPFFGECKWWSDPVGENVLDRLVDYVSRTRYGDGAATRHFLVYSRSGFTADLKRRARATRNVHLFGLSDLLGSGTR